MDEQKAKTGTTTIGIVCKDCVIMGSDRRMTAGHFIVGKDFQKIHPITDHMVLTISGVVSDVQLVMKYLKAEVKLKGIRSGREPTLKEIANLLSTWNYSMLRGQYSISGFLLGGVDGADCAVYDISPDGALKKNNKYVSSGSGSIFAYGVFESAYKEGMSEQEGVKLAVSALNAAMQRDSASGNGVDVFVISKEGVRKVFEKSIDSTIKA